MSTLTRSNRRATTHQHSLGDALAAGGIEGSDDPASRLDYDTNLRTLTNCEFVVEAVPERLELKRDLDRKEYLLDVA